MLKPFNKIKDKGICAGYTIIETMVAVSVFLIVVLAGMNALFNVNLISHKSQDIRSIMDNMSFIMEEMSRSIRTGYNYRCYDANNPWSSADAQSLKLSYPRSCTLGGVLAFEESQGSTPDSSPADLNGADQWVYKIIESTAGSGEYNIWKSSNGGLNFVQLNPSEIVIKSALGEGVSGFKVLGAESVLDGNTQQPLVVIRLIGEIRYNKVTTPFSLQTTATQRLVDI